MSGQETETQVKMKDGETVRAIAKWDRFSLSAYDRIGNVSDFINRFGKAIADSKMFGCKNIAQGQVLAMACVVERMSPVELMRRYHIIGGNLSMKADAMLAEFRREGGDHSLITRTPDVAEIELRMGKGRGTKCHRFKFTWDEAQQESYVYGKDGKTLKENWSTPRRRMQMLWARLISDSVRVMCPEVNAGQYTPEELGGTVGDAEMEPEPEDQPIDAECSVVEEPPQPEPQPEPEPPQPEPKPDAFQQATDNENHLLLCQLSGDLSGTVTRPQLLEMKRLRDKLDLAAVAWEKVVGKFGVTTAKDLTYDHAERVLSWLTRRERESTQQENLSQWANEQVNASAGPEGE